MGVPDFQSFMLPLLKLTADGEEHSLVEAIEHLAQAFQLTDEDRTQLLRSGQTRLYNRVAWATTYLRKARLLQAAGKGRFRITDQGREVLATNPGAIDVAFLESRFEEVQEFRGGRASSGGEDDEPPATFDHVAGTWTLREGVEERIREKLAHSIPNEEARRAALALLAFTIENADEERADAWYVKETTHGLALMAGRLLACKITRSRAQVSVVGPIADEVRAALGAEAEDDDEFKSIPGSVLLRFPVEHAGAALRLLQDGLNSFVDLAMGRVRRAVSLEDHTPEAVSYVATIVGRDLPQPVPVTLSASAAQVDDESEDEDAAVSRDPRVRGRAPIFEHGQRSIASLISDIEPERAVIALPDLQRPFVWVDTKVRDLLDSLFLGFPVGTLVLWHTTNEKEARALGADRLGLRATTLVIDGQQRLTSLYAVVRGQPVVGKDGEKRRIVIAFRPRDGRFEVADAAIRNDPEFLADVAELWSGKRTRHQIRKDLMNALRDKGRAVDEKYEEAVELNLERAHALTDYRFPTVDIRKTLATRDEEATEEDVAEIFVRINNQGTRLGQADFVLTLLSVFHGPLRDRIEERARAMSEGALVALDTQQLLRAACAVAFGRARMKAIYRSLRGVDPTTGEADAAGRARRLDELDRAAQECVELTPWRDYALRVKHAGFVNQGLIASKNAVVNAFAFYIRGRRAGVPRHELDEVIARWVFATLLTARYSGSSETMFEEDLTRVGNATAGNGHAFVRVLDEAMSETLTGDYWTRTLVASLGTQKGRAPAALAFRAAQVVIGARALFSDQLLQNLLDPPAQGNRAASEARQLFPQAYLHGRGVRDRRQVNQVANLADVGWYENNVIGARNPAEYVPKIRQRLGLGDEQWGRMCAEHALPLGWEGMEYDVFLAERRRRMAEIIRVAFRRLGGEGDAQPVSPPWFLAGAEVVWQRIAETERALRGVVREVYTAAFGDRAAEKIETALSEHEREVLSRALRARPTGAEPLSIVDYLYLGQLPQLLFAADAWPRASQRLGGAADLKQRIQTAIGHVAPVRNEIAHVREVEQERLMRATVACSDVMAMVRGH